MRPVNGSAGRVAGGRVNGKRRSRKHKRSNGDDPTEGLVAALVSRGPDDFTERRRRGGERSTHGRRRIVDREVFVLKTNTNIRRLTGENIYIYVRRPKRHTG